MTTTREFHFSEGASDKFWRIAIDGAAFTVHFGRKGTKGQAQEKSFSSKEAAQQAADKLIAEKTGKGYVEVSDTGVASPTPTVKEASSKPAPVKQSVSAAATAPASPVRVPAAPAASQAKLQVSSERRIRLDEDDWRIATWRTVAAKPIPAVRPFDQQQCVARLAKLRGSYWWNWDFSGADLSPMMSKQEAGFWLLAMANGQGEFDTPREMAEKLAKETIPESMSRDDVIRVIGKNSDHLNEYAVIPLRHLLTPVGMLKAITEVKSAQGYYVPMQSLFPGIIHSHVLPYLNAVELEELRAVVRPHITPAGWNARLSAYDGRLFTLAARLGLSREIATVVAALPDKAAANNHYIDHFVELVLGLGSSDEVLTQADRLEILPQSARQVRGWLAATEFRGIEHVLKFILQLTDKDKASELAKVLALAEGPEVAPAMLEIREKSRAPAVGREWLERHPGHSIVGLAPLLGTASSLAEPALEWLRFLKKQLGVDALTAAAAGLDGTSAERLRELVIDHQAKEYPPVAAGDPPWFASASAGLKASKVPSWAEPAALPPLVWNGQRLSDEQVRLVIQAVRAPDESKPLLSALRKHLDPHTCDQFAWKLFQGWLGDGAPSAQKWAMVAVGHLGSDGCITRLTPLIRAWPGESQHARAVLGLEVLRTIGSDLALMQLNGIAQKLPFKGLKARAAECMEEIAKEKGLSRAELEDRIIPDCGLDERGQRVFDFGPRQFQFVLGPELKPVLRDAAGKVLTALPKPNAKDDAAKAEAATDEWKILKKQVADTASIQSGRLEQAMVTGRRWPSDAFRRLLIQHPLMIHIVRLVLWGGYDAAGKRTHLFRVTEEQETVDAQDKPFDLTAGANIGVVHPLTLSAQEKGTWGQVMSDYGVVAPFAQLARPTNVPLPAEIESDAFTRFNKVKLPAPTLVFGLEKFGWYRGAAMDAGGFCEHLKPFASANCTAIVTYDGCVSMGYIQPEENLEITGCFLVPGLYRADWYPEHKVRVPFANADPVVLSEVLNDLLQLAAKAK